ncbi:serine/threonine-protein kinase [Sorangium sp. So ce131]|uniref:serine/threonine-protein kinase n=1 Tax=Sorangium sp. So ce131 TaxID=3133282 RepID=UPI003F6260F6
MTSVDEHLSPGALFQGRFLIERLLGRGGMGEVWAALDTALERPVAIKVIHPALAGEARYAGRFLREMKLVARVAHPNIVRLYDAGATGSGRLFMVMERVFGVPLREMIAGGARLDVVRALHVAIQIADALSTAHDAALVHRDVKPENILVSEGVHARLLDFGVAKDARGLGLTRQGSAVGTSRYMAPEQISGSSAADGRADLYALGVVTYEMLAGAHPYAVIDAASGIGETEILAAHVHMEARPLPEVLPDCPEALWRAVARCLAKRPEERFARAEELASALREVARQVMPAETALTALEEASARQLLREAEDAARERAIRGGGSALRAGVEGELVRLVAAVPAERGPARGAAAGGAGARSRLAMAQRFKVEPAWGLSVARAGEGTEGGDAATRRPLPELPAPEPVLPVPAPVLPADAGVMAVEATRLGAGTAAYGAETSTLVSTEKWEGAEAVLAGVAREGRLARTEPWREAQTRAGAGVVGVSVAPRRASWGLVVVGVLVLGLTAALLAVVVVRLARG